MKLAAEAVTQRKAPPKPSLRTSKTLEQLLPYCYPRRTQSIDLRKADTQPFVRAAEKYEVRRTNPRFFLMQLTDTAAPHRLRALMKPFRSPICETVRGLRGAQSRSFRAFAERSPIAFRSALRDDEAKGCDIYSYDALVFAVRVDDLALQKSATRRILQNQSSAAFGIYSRIKELELAEEALIQLVCCLSIDPLVSRLTFCL